MKTDSFSSLRESVRSAVEDLGLRRVASGVGISPASLTNFLAGATRPLPGTVDKLRRWELRHRAAAGEGRRPDPEVVRAAIDALTAPIDPERRAEAAQRLMSSVREQWRTCGVQVPSWAEYAPIAPSPPRAEPGVRFAAGGKTAS